ncbi:MULTISPECIES: hypothetical protein [Kamptonema]|uniref:hypothetical protein n=1 Tax=Kamptonema TaxID=1501433 RepID=UPI0001DAC40F|nr:MULTISPECIES: hypothetical protein [Kamptonema]CBN56088.1 hypothetical protein OSCI_2770004 [Kamptonema sp. PCC 6506]
MKIYTFNAASDTRVELLWPLRPDNRDPAFDKLIAETHWSETHSLKHCDLAIYPQKVFNPENRVFDDSVLDAVKEAEIYNKPLIIDATCDLDTPLDIPTANILRFGLYKSLKKPFETERPYWSNQKTKTQLEALEILPRSQKPAVGFCGTTSAAGKFFKIGNSLPFPLSKALLSQGNLAQKIDMRLKKGMSHQLRKVAMDLLAEDRRIDSHFDITNTLQDYYNPANINRVLLEDRFIDNMRKSDYSLCVRANGNYSGRFYMALNAGCIPLVIDTDVEIPFEEKIHLLKVPLKSLYKIGDLVVEHFEKITNKEFQEMKLENRAIYNELMAPDRFIPNFIESILQKANS